MKKAKLNGRMLIAIPSYERYDALIKLLSRLSAINPGNVDFAVFNNCSSDLRYYRDLPVQVEQLFPKGNCKVYHNPFNVGISGNFIKCFEASKDYQWLWMIGDDDDLKPEFSFYQLFKLLNSLKEDVACVGFSTGVADISTIKNVSYYGFYDVIENISLGSLLFVSCVIYRTSEVLPYLVRGFHASDTHCPHVAMIMASVSDGSGFYASQLEPIIWNPSDRKDSVDPSFCGRKEISIDVFKLIQLSKTWQERSILYQALVRSFVSIDLFVKEARSLPSGSLFSRIDLIWNFCLNTLLFDRRYASKFGAIMAFFLIHSDSGEMVFNWLRFRAKKIFPRKKKFPSLKY